MFKISFMFYTLLTILFLVPSLLFSGNISVDIAELSKDPTWLKLIHFDRSEDKSMIVSKDFYLSKDGQNSPKKELEATIKAYISDSDNNDSSSICRFPARYYWLNKHIDLPNYRVIDPKCKRLSKWKTFKETTSISFIFVSGYLGNPASVFGHSFLKLNRENESNLRSNLFDTSINYGALVPEDEPGFVYVTKGLFGGYKAGFSDKYYYIQDLVYSNTEFRDIWNYKLDLDEDKRTFLLLHIWEMIGKKFQYFFLNKNCAYEVSKLLELVLDEPIVGSSFAWYAPVESCHSIKKIKQKAKKPFIKDVTYVPSDQRVIYTNYKNLSDKAKDIVFTMIENFDEKIPSKYDYIDENQKIEIVDFVLGYYKYLLVKDRENNTTIKHKNKILLERLKLPSRKKSEVIIPKRPSPDNDNDIMAVGLGYGHSSDKKDYNTIEISPFLVESIGQNSLDGNEFKLFDIKLGIVENELFLDRIDFVKLRNFKTMHMPFDNENPWSWMLDLGLKKEKNYNAFIEAGYGRSTMVYEDIILFSMLQASLNSEKAYFRLMPVVGSFLNFQELKTLFYVGYKSSFDDGKDSPIFHIESAYSIEKDYDLKLLYDRDKKSRFSIVLRRFFDL